jgi:ketosteroid isomerase-like protein
MNLIQQAVERAGQMEREGKLSAAPLPMHSPLQGAQSRSFRPTPLNPSRVPLAALGLAVLAVMGGALLYVALQRTQGEGHAVAATKLALASPALPSAAPAAAKSAAPVATAAASAVAAPAAAAPVATVAAVTPELDNARATIESWARAWSERDVSGYLAHYGEGFTPDRGASRSAWEKNRRQMIERRRSITVSIAKLRLEQVSDHRIVAHYVQDYTADTYRETGTPKRLVLERESTGWRIVAETADTTGGRAS